MIENANVVSVHRFVKAVAFDFGQTLVDERFADDQIQLMPGVRELLPQIGHPMGVWANTRTANELEIRRLLKIAGIEQYFASVVTSVDAGFRKPAPEFFQFALAKGDFEKETTLFVGNQLNTDVAGAERFGIRTAWLSAVEFRSDDETMTLDDARPSFIVSDMTQLLGLLREISIAAPHASSL
jgi:HAD superfamily hydrolase (TIGR01509 family)